ncbi:ETX/MTX2 family pore-forming toxin [Elizabethkingia ursingii]|uniref:ETX/MTX2 family pore-forming toxin n=1 Tax=Elizabethkingia ursingii TaxID=1756150 RepID=UPI000751A41B|nr:ETX/MTX2 family pore-forming toxin [Elizabethkingia ursingii]KUY31911.1 hypothetical protein ATB96_01250 [Elizabethkingia ursingii]
MGHSKQIFTVAQKFIYAISLRSFSIVIGSVSIVLFLNSCTVDEPFINNMDGIKEEIGDELFKNKTREDLIHEGWTEIKEIFPQAGMTKVSTTRSSSLADSGSNEKEIPFTSTYLKQLGYRIDTPEGKDVLKNLFGVLVVFNPDFYFVNDRSKQYENFMKSVNTCNICGGEVDKFVNKESRDKTNLSISVGIPQSKIEDKKIVIPDEIYGEQVVENRGNTPVTQNVKIAVKEGYSVSWDSKNSAQLKVGAKTSIGVPMVAGVEVAAEFIIGSDLGYGENKTTEKTIEQSVEVTVPPHSRVRVVALTKRNGTSFTYFVPIKFMGNIIASPQDINEPKILDINDKSFESFLSKNSDGERGILKVMEIISSTLIVSPSEPL